MCIRDSTQMGIMLQDSFIFSGTIMDNIRYGRLDATDEEVEKQYNDLAEKYSMDVGELKKYLDAMSVRTQIIRDKAISVVVDSAKIEKKKAPKKEAEGEAAEGEEKPAKKTAAKKSAKKEEEKAE